MALVIQSERCGLLRLVLPRGRLDTETSSELELFAHDQIKAGESHFVVDLSGVDYVSSAGLRVLLMMAKSLDGESQSLRLSGLSSHVREVFDISGFTQLFQMFPSLEQAVRAHPMAPENDAEISAIMVQLVGPGQQAPVVDPGLAELAARLLGADVPGKPPATAQVPDQQAASQAATGAKDTSESWLQRLVKRVFGR